MPQLIEYLSKEVGKRVASFHRLVSLALLGALLLAGCNSDQDSNTLTGEEVLRVMNSDFETIQFAIKAAACGELAFKFDPQLSDELLTRSYDAFVTYFESRQTMQSRIGQNSHDNGFLFDNPRENAAVALGRELGVADARLLQGVKERGGGDVIAAARETFDNDNCSDL